MNAERWQQVKTIFHRAAECDPAARAAFLRESCGDDADLRSEVESLLASEQHPASLLENPVLAAGAVAAAAPPNRTGPVLPERYEILAELGRGGMGIVYKARDRETGEVIALKILKPEIAADLQIIERFKNELRLAHRITHHNVARLYEFHRTGDTVYLSMEYVEGESLCALLHRTGKLDLALGLTIARQLAAGVSAAHRQSIAHRDLKPENIMLTAAGEVKVLDFGISRYYAANATATIGFIGTPAYMAPEQAQGTLTDHRTDIYALGLILYEMFTGTKAFTGDTPVSLALKQVRESPPPPRTLAPLLPVHIEQAILKCLEKHPADRFQSVEDLLHALAGGAAEPSARLIRPRRSVLLAGTTVLALAIAAGALWYVRPGKSPLPAQNTPSIAVLPFADMSAEKNQEYLAEGIAEELRDALAKVPGLRVAWRISSTRVKDESFELIGRKLNVATILQGSVRKQGNRARVAVQLLRSADGSLLWSETYERELNDILVVQQEIARAVTGALKITLLAGKSPSPSVRNTNTKAYNDYLLGRYFLRLRNKENLEKAVTYFEHAIQLDPGYAPAWAKLAVSRTSQAGIGYVPSKEGYQKARQEVDRALVLDPDLADAHAALGQIRLTHDWDWAGADVSFRRARALEPGNPDVIIGAGSLAANLGRFEDAIPLYRRSIEIDPLNPIAYHQLGIALYSAGQQEDATAAFKKALELAPERAKSHCLLGMVYLEQLHPTEALTEMQKEKDPQFRAWGLALAFHALGRKKESDANLAELTDKFPKDYPYQIAGVYAFRGETDLAFHWLQRAYAEPDPGLRDMKTEPVLRNLRRDPRFAALLKKMGLPL